MLLLCHMLMAAWHVCVHSCDSELNLYAIIMPGSACRAHAHVYKVMLHDLSTCVVCLKKMLQQTNISFET